jgi:ubiquinol-cytochrome c reductase subunit 6
MSYAYTPEFFTKFPKTFIKPEKDGEGDWIDPKERLAPNCLGHCSQWMNEYMSCVARVHARTDGKGDCNGQFMEYAMCQDHCIGKDLFNYLK